MDFIAIGQQFVQHYYNVFDTNRPNLKELYTEESMLTFEGEQFKGVAGILDKFNSFGTIQHVIKSFDAQPSVNNGILCFISGDLHIDGSENPVKFAQVFHLLPGGSAGFFCFNDMFRLNYG
jgi:hypothetical protein